MCLSRVQQPRIYESRKNASALCVCVCILQQVVPRRRGASSSHRSSNGRYISNFQMMRPRNHKLKILVEAWRLYFLKACKRDDEMTRVVRPAHKAHINFCLLYATARSRQQEHWFSCQKKKRAVGAECLCCAESRKHTGNGEEHQFAKGRERERETLYKINHIKLNAISHRAKKWSCNALLWSLPQNGDRALNAFSTNLICPSYCCGSIKWYSTAHTSYRIWCFYIDATSYTHKHMAQSKSAVRCIRFNSITSRSPYTVRCGDGHILSYGATLCISSLE